MLNVFTRLGGWLVVGACALSVHALPTALPTWTPLVASSQHVLPRTNTVFVQETVTTTSNNMRALIGGLLALFIIGIAAGVVTLWLCWERGWVCCGRREIVDEEYEGSALASTRGIYDKLEHPPRMHHRRERMRAYLEHKTRVEEKVLAWRTQARLPGL